MRHTGFLYLAMKEGNSVANVQFNDITKQHDIFKAKPHQAVKSFFDPGVLPNKPSIAIITLQNTHQRRLNHGSTIKPFHGFSTPESFLDYTGAQ